MRLDTELQADVMQELAWEPKVDSANIGVAVDKGAVTLTGHVRTYAELISRSVRKGLSQPPPS